MQHARLLGILLGLLLLSAGGVFFLMDSPEDVSLNTPLESPGELMEDVESSSLTASAVAADEKFGDGNEYSDGVIQPQPSPSAASQQKPQTTPTPPAVAKTAPDVIAPTPQPPPKPVGKININTAGLSELEQITGVGPALAQRIIDYRNTVSLFYVIEDIKNVSGIGDATFEKMKNEITVGNVGPAPQPPPPVEPAPSPEPIPPQPQPDSSNHVFYTSSYHSSKYYYCDTDSAWEGLSEKYLESYSSEEAVLVKYPEKTLHEPCT